MNEEDTLNAKVSDVLPTDFKIHEELGKGSNNKVFRVTWNGDEVILRTPRRRSDTQQRGSAKWEYLHTLCASNIGVAPKLRKAWFSRHAEQHEEVNWPSGLYMVMDYYAYDLEKFIMSKKSRNQALEKSSDIGAQILLKLECLTKNDMFVYDLKPSNIVLNVEGGLDVRIIDYGRDFCELNSPKCKAEVDINTPVLNIVNKLTNGDSELMKHIIFAVMLIQLSSTTTRHIYEDRGEHRMSREERREINPIVAPASNLIESMQGKNIKVLRDILRCDEVRSVLKHYHGRRNGGTKRTLQFATASVC
jgi:serine/threonine protein kinase